MGAPGRVCGGAPRAEALNSQEFPKFCFWVAAAVKLVTALPVYKTPEAKLQHVGVEMTKSSTAIKPVLGKAGFRPLWPHVTGVEAGVVEKGLQVSSVGGLTASQVCGGIYYVWDVKLKTTEPT